jgi:hypothetical protein
MAQIPQEVDRHPVDVLIGETFHRVNARRRMLSSAGKVDVLGGKDVHCVLNASAHVVGLQVGIVIARDLVETNSFPDQFQNALHRNARTRNAGFSEVNLWIDGDSILHDSILARQAAHR